MGYKTERGGSLALTTNGGQTEIVGGLAYSTVGGSMEPMFVQENGGRLAAVLSHAHFGNDPYRQIVVETRDGQTKVTGDEKAWKGLRPVFYESGLK